MQDWIRALSDKVEVVTQNQSMTVAEFFISDTERAKARREIAEMKRRATVEGVMSEPAMASALQDIMRTEEMGYLYNFLRELGRYKRQFDSDISLDSPSVRALLLDQANSIFRKYVVTNETRDGGIERTTDKLSQTNSIRRSSSSGGSSSCSSCGGDGGGGGGNCRNKRSSVESRIRTLGVRKIEEIRRVLEMFSVDVSTPDSDLSGKACVEIDAKGSLRTQSPLVSLGVLKSVFQDVEAAALKDIKEGPFRRLMLTKIFCRWVRHGALSSSSSKTRGGRRGRLSLLGSS
eukprot:g4628.t1